MVSSELWKEISQWMSFRFPETVAFPPARLAFCFVVRTMLVIAALLGPLLMSSVWGFEVWIAVSARVTRL